MSSQAAIPGILVLLGVVLVLVGLMRADFSFVVVGAVVAIAGGGFAVLTSRGETRR